MHRKMGKSNYQAIHRKLNINCLGRNEESLSLTFLSFLIFKSQ